MERIRMMTMRGRWVGWLASAALVVSSAGLVAQQLAKTAELTKRGLTAADFPRLIPLAKDVYAYEGVHVQGAITTNSLIVVTSDGVLVADGQGTTAQVERMVADIRNLTDKPIKYVVIGSNHGDHTGGNTAFPTTATFISHPVSQAVLQRASTTPGRDGGPPPKVVVPTEVVSDKRVITLGATEIQILFLGRSHTGADLVVYLPATKVLFMSETYMHRMFPSMAGGYPAEWIEAIKKAEAMNADVYVPGHGFVDDPATLKAELPVFRHAIEKIRDEAQRLKAAGVPAEEAAAKANLGEFADWSVREQMAPPAFRRAYAELEGTLR
jgi:glyoxylase-like metal-dependent hydrolase (beta-lactamase superfamily II)